MGIGDDVCPCTMDRWADKEVMMWWLLNGFVRGLFDGGILRCTLADEATIDWHPFLKSCTEYARGLHAAQSGYN